MSHWPPAVAEARSTLRVACQVADEAFTDGLLSQDELQQTKKELWQTYRETLHQLGVDPSALPDPTKERPPKKTPSAHYGSGDSASSLLSTVPGADGHSPAKTEPMPRVRPVGPDWSHPQSPSVRARSGVRISLDSDRFAQAAERPMQQAPPSEGYMPRSVLSSSLDSNSLRREMSREALSHRYAPAPSASGAGSPGPTISAGYARVSSPVPHPHSLPRPSSRGEWGRGSADSGFGADGWGTPAALEREHAELEMQMGELAVRVAETEKLRVALERERGEVERARADSEARAAAAERAAADAMRRAVAAEQALELERASTASKVERARQEASSRAEAEGAMVHETLAESTAALAEALKQTTVLKQRVAELEQRLAGSAKERDAALGREKQALGRVKELEAAAALDKRAAAAAQADAAAAAQAAKEAAAREAPAQAPAPAPAPPPPPPPPAPAAANSASALQTPAADLVSRLAAASPSVTPRDLHGVSNALRSPSRLEHLAAEALRGETAGQLAEADRRIAKLEARLELAGLPEADSPSDVALEVGSGRRKQRRREAAAGAGAAARGRGSGGGNGGGREMSYRKQGAAPPPEPQCGCPVQ